MNKGIRKISVLVLALIMILTMSVASFAGSTITKKQAVNKALKNAKLTKSKVYALHSEYDDGKYEIEFYKKSNDAEYSYEYSRSGRLLEKSIDFVYKRNTSDKKIGKTAARKKAAKFTGIKYSTVKKGTCRYEYDDGEGKYEIEFYKGNYKYELDILAPTGKVTDYSKEYIG